MLSKPQIGMKVRIMGVASFTETVSGKTTARFDSSLCNTGVLIDVKKNAPNAHSPKVYYVKLDSPNYGVYEFLGTGFLERV